jgi:hypothetical protein
MIPASLRGVSENIRKIFENTPTKMQRVLLTSAGLEVLG